MSSEEAQLVFQKHAELLQTLDTYEQTVYNAWSASIVDESEQNLNKPLLVREKGLLRVNFDPKVVALLREVRYFEALQVKPPATAANIYAKAEVFRKDIFSLDHIAGTYNGIRTGVLDVEKPLIEDRIRAIDDQIHIALTTLNWKSEDIESYILEISKSVGDLSTVLQTLKNNVAQIQKIMRAWCASPLIERKDGKKLLNIEEKQARLDTVFECVKRDGKTIHSLVDQTRDLLGVEEGSEKWERYKVYVDGIVKDGFLQAIRTSVEYLVANMDTGKVSELGPLMEAKLELENEMLVYTPAMEEGEFSLIYDYD